MGNRRSGDPILEAEQNGEEGITKLTESLARGLRILECFEHGDQSLTNLDIMSRTSLPKPTVSRLCYTLMALGYLDYDNTDGSYRLSVGLLKLARPLISREGVLQLLRPIMKRLASETNCTVAIGQRSGVSMVYVSVVRGASRVNLDIGVGYSVPVLFSSMGRAQLAAMPGNERKELLEKLVELEGERALEIAEKATRSFRELGYAKTLGELNPGVNAAAVPLGVPGSDNIICLMCGGPANILTPELVKDSVGPKLAQIARDYPPAG